PEPGPPHPGGCAPGPAPGGLGPLPVELRLPLDDPDPVCPLVISRRRLVISHSSVSSFFSTCSSRCSTLPPPLVAGGIIEPMVGPCGPGPLPGPPPPMGPTGGAVFGS